MPKTLNAQQLNELNNWLKSLNINAKKLSRDFSDAVAMAILLKIFYPKKIDLNNYPSCNSTQLKIKNWTTLNAKVLANLGKPQTPVMIENLAKGTPGVIEIVLYELMKQQKYQQHKKQEELENETEKLWAEQDGVLMVNVNKRIGDAIIQIPQKMILFTSYEEILRKSCAMEEDLIAVEKKIYDLENAIASKTKRIEELCAQLPNFSVKSTMKTNNSLCSVSTTRSSNWWARVNESSGLSDVN